MTEIDDLMAELRRRIMRPSGGALPKPAPVEAVAPVPLRPAMPEPDLEQRRGSAAVALRRLSHLERDGGTVAEDDPAVSELLGHLKEIVTAIERRTAELDEREGARPMPAAPERIAPMLPDDDTGMATISLRLDTWLLAHIDADAKRRGISRTAWLQSAASERLENRR